MATSWFETTVAPARSREQFWQTRWFWWLLALLSTAPFWFTPLPPLGDLFSHMGRYHVVLNHDDSPFLQQYYRVQWALIPNLGQDLLMMGMGPLFGIERGAIISTAAIPFLTVLLIGMISRAAHGSVQPLALLALPFTYPMTLNFGFVNFHTGLVVCLGAVLFWLRSQNMAVGWRYGILAVAAAIAWLCHASAWAILVAGIGALELAAGLAATQGRLLSAARSATVRTLPLMWPVLLFLLGPTEQSNSGQDKPDGFELETYLRWYWVKFNLIYTLRDQYKIVDYGISFIVFAVPFSLFIVSRVTLALGLAIWALGLFFLYWLIPPNILGGSYADFRLLSMVGIAALLACQLRAGVKVATVVAMLGLCLFTLRLGVTGYGWAVTGGKLQDDLKALAMVPAGARVAAAAPRSYCGSYRMEGYSHLASLAIIRRNAFVSSQWDLPGQQVMQPIYLPGSKYNSIQQLDAGVRSKSCGAVSVADYLAGLPRNRFDFVWLFNADTPDDAAPWLKLLYRGAYGRLYSIRRDGSSSVTRAAQPRPDDRPARQAGETGEP